jgi:hypothetical protein
VEVEPPRRLKRWVDRFSPQQLEAIAKKLREGSTLTDATELCESRSQAYYRAEALIEALGHIGLERYLLRRRTWPENGGQRWSVQMRKE